MSDSAASPAVSGHSRDEAGNFSTFELVLSKGEIDGQHNSDDAAHADRTASPWAGYVNLLKTCIGSGILGLPYAFSQTGWGLGLLFLLLAGAAAAYALFLLSACAHRLGGTNTSYAMLVSRTFPWAQSIVDFLILFNGFGSAASYLIVIGQNLQDLSLDVFGIPSSSFLSTAAFWKIVVFWGIIAPLSCLSKLSALKYTSTVGLICAFYICVITAVYLAPSIDACANYLPEPHCGGEVVAVSSNGSSILASISIFAFAFTCSQNIFLVYNEIRQPSLQRLRNYVGNPSMLTATIVYIITSMSAYFTFGSLVNSDLILSYPVNDVAIIIGSFFVVLITTASSPLQIHPARQAFMTLIYYICGLVADWRRGRGSQQQVEKSDPYTWLGGKFHLVVYWATTFTLLVGIFITAMLVSDLGTLFAIIGAVASTGLMYYIPGFAFFKLFGEDAAVQKEAEQQSKDMEVAKPDAMQVAQSEAMFDPTWLLIHRCTAMFMAIVGVVTMAVSLANIALSEVTHGPSA